MTGNPDSLPLYRYLDEIETLLRSKGTLILTAEPGAGKTTLLPWQLLRRGAARKKILLLEPRRIAARSAAERIAFLLGERLGESVGLRTRRDTVTGRRVRLEVVTEGVAVRIIQSDPGLEDFDTVIFDEFHTRSLPGDLAFALVRDLRASLRPDLRVVVMSATLGSDELRAVFPDAGCLSVPGRTYPVTVHLRPPLPGEKPSEGAARLVAEALSSPPPVGSKESPAPGVLVFLPGWRELEHCRNALHSRTITDQIEFLHGTMEPDAQRRVLDPDRAEPGRVILATNVAETSLTVPGVGVVVDSGLERCVRYSPRTGMDHWDTRAVSLASQTQRAGRAGRLGPGTCYRWEGAELRRPAFAPPEILESDPAGLVLECALWGAVDPAELPWLTPPPQASLDVARKLLRELGLLDDSGAVTATGRRAAALGLHPRLARMVLDAKDKATAAYAAALLEEGDFLSGKNPDFRLRLDILAGYGAGGTEENHENAEKIRRVKIEARRILAQLGEDGRDALPDPGQAGLLLLSAFPDRAGRRLGHAERNQGRYILAGGRGALVDGELGREEFIAAAELDGGAIEAKIFLAAPVARRDLESGAAGRPIEVCVAEWKGWRPRVRVEYRIGSLVLKERTDLPVDPDFLRREAMARLKKEGLSCLPWSKSSERFLSRCRFLDGRIEGWPDFSDAALLTHIEEWLLPFAKTGAAVSSERSELFDAASVHDALVFFLGREHRRRLDEEAPDALVLPSGSRKVLDYETGETPFVSAKIQEFFGWKEGPKVGGKPVVLDLLNPANRTVQRTSDLAGFWSRTYPGLKKELSRRYPKHWWPDNPITAQATRGMKPR